MSQQVNTQPYGILIMAMTLLGAVVNVSSIILLSKTKRSSMFHSLLKILSLYDLVVIFGCSALYALPNEWNYYRWEIYPFLLPWLLPIVQIAMMSSVYCTVVMSFERYVRICYICQLRGSSYLTEENYKFYVMAFTLGPLLFYAPKFFEIRTEKTVHEYTKLLNCSQILVELAEVHSMPDVKRTSDEQDCLKLNLTLSQLAEHSFQELLNVTRSVEFNDILPTQLRLSSLYYKIYCIGFNSVFASVVPLASLFYLNICTIIALRKMKLQVSGIEAKTNEHPLTKRSQEKASVHYRNGSHRIRAIFSQSPGESRRSSSLPEQEDEVDEKLGNTSSLLRPPSVSDTYASQLNSSRGNDVATSNSAKKTSSQCCQGCLTNTDQIEVIQTSSEDSRSIRRKTMIATDDEEDDGEINNSSINTESLIGRAGGSNLEVTFENGTTSTIVVNNERRKRRRRRRRTRKSSENYTNESSVLMRRQENRLTRISLGIVTLYILCHIWRIIPTAYEALYSEDGTVLSDWPSWLVHIYHLSHSLIVTNSAINFLLYVVL